MFVWAYRIALALGAILIVSGLIVDHPPIYFGVAVEYPSQAVAIAKRVCGGLDSNLLKDTSLWWRAWLSHRSMDYNGVHTAYVWSAGFYEYHGGNCMLLIDPHSGQVLDMRMGVAD